MAPHPIRTGVTLFFRKSVVITTDALTQDQVVTRLIVDLKGDYDDGTDHTRYDAGRGH